MMMVIIIIIIIIIIIVTMRKYIQRQTNAFVGLWIYLCIV